MGNLKDAYDVGVEQLQFWTRFKGRRVRVWPSELTMRVCSESGVWVTPAPGESEPVYWEEERNSYRSNEDQAKRDKAFISGVANQALDPKIPNIEAHRLETVNEARLLEATITDLIRTPPALYLTEVEYWMVGNSETDSVRKVASRDEGMILPLAECSRIDFVNSVTGSPRSNSPWSK